MSLNVGELTAYLRLNDDDFRDALGQAPRQAQQAGSRIESSMRGAERATEGAADQTRGLGRGFNEAGSAATGFGSKLKVAGAAMAGLFAGGALIEFFRDSIDAASDLNETVNKSNTIFGSAAGTIDKWSDGAAKSLGLSKAAALDAAAGFGNMFTQLGFAEKAAGDMSTQTIQLAADLGSFNNLETDDVVDRLSGAFRGEYDSLQALIPNINAARVETEAMAATGKTSAAQLTAQEKATAVLAIVQKDGAKAAGDFAKTSDGLANSQKIVTAQLEDSKARIGQGLLPVWQKLVDLFGQYGVPAIEALGSAFAGLLNVMSPIIDILVGAVKAVADLPGPLLVAAAAIGGWLLFGTVAGMVSTFAGSVVAAGVAVKGFLVSLGPIGIAVIALTTAMAFLMDSTDQTAEITQAASDRWDRLKGTLDGVTGAVTDATKAQLASEAQSTGMLSTLQDLGVSTKDYIDASAGVAGAQEKLSAGVADATTKVLAQSEAYKAVREDLSAAGVSQQEFIKALSDGDPSEIVDKVNAYAEAQARLTGNTSTAADIQNRFGAAVGETGGPLSVLSGVMNLAGDDAGKFGAEADAAAQRALALGDSTAGAADGVAATGDAAAGAADPMKTLADATKEMGSEASNADTEAQFLIATLDELSGGVVASEQAARLNAAAFREIGSSQRDLADAHATLAEKQAELTKLQNDGTSTAEQQAAAFREVQDASDAVSDAEDGVTEAGIKARDSAIRLATAAFEQAGGFGNLQAATVAATAKTEEQRAAWIAAQPEADRLTGKADATATALFGIPGAVATSITEQGAANVQSQAGGVTQSVNNIPGSKNVFIDTNAGTVIGTINGLQQVINNLTGKSVVIQTIREEIVRGTVLATPYAGGSVRSYLRGFALGGKLPGTPPSDPTVDNLPAVGPGGQPFRLRSNEWIISEPASKYYGDAMLSAINNRTFPKTAGYALGGSPAGAGMTAAPSVTVNVNIDGTQLDYRAELIVDGKLQNVATLAKTMGGQTWASP